MTDVVLDVPDDMIVALKVAPERFRDEVRLAAAVKLLDEGRYHHAGDIAKGRATAVAPRSPLVTRGQARRAQ